MRKSKIKYIDHTDYMEGVTEKGYSFYIDKDDYDKVKDYCWFDCVGYMRNAKLGLLHRYVTQVDSTKEIDHINRNRRDCRKANLLICDRLTNMQNKSSYSNNTSGYKGVKWNKTLNKWQVQITVNKKRIHLGVFEKLQDAIVARKQAEIEYKLPIKGNR